MIINIDRLLATSKFPELDKELKINVALGVNNLPLFEATVRRVRIPDQEQKQPWISANYRFLRAMNKEHAYSLVSHNEVDLALNRVYTIIVTLEYE